MDLPPELLIVHEPVRLRIMSVLFRQSDAGFTALRMSLGITPGNLSSHAAKLAGAGLLEARDALTKDGFEKRYQITQRGIETFTAYLATIETFLQTARAPPPAPVAAAARSEAPATSKGTIVGAFIGGAFFLLSEFAVEFLADSTGSTYVGIAATGLVIASIGPVRRLLRR